MIRWQQIVLVAGIASLIVSLLPWLGLGDYAFIIPGWQITLPRIDVLNSKRFYEVVAFPVQVVALVPPLGDFVYFAGEGRATVRPFAVFLFWFLLGMCFVWRYCQKTKQHNPTQHFNQRS